MVIKNFEDIIAWQQARDLTKEIYFIFGSHKDFGFKDQILRASVSIMNNIAEGFDRGSSKEFKKFLIIARGSAAEVRSMLILAYDLGYITEEQKNNLTTSVKNISKLLTGFIKKLSTVDGSQVTA